MTISYIAPLAVGNAIEILLSPPQGTRRCRVLRKRADTIMKADDPAANVVFDGEGKYVIDHDALLANRTTYYYRAFYRTLDGWVASESRSVVPASTALDLQVDTLDVVQARLEAGFRSYVERGLLTHPNENSIPVMLAAPAFEGAPFPLVTVSLMADSPAHRFVGESFGQDLAYVGKIEGFEDDVAGEVEGYLSHQQIQIIAWTTNGDQRKLLRKALKAIVLANLPIFEAAGLQMIEPQFADVDDMTTYAVPMYQATSTLSCIAPAAVEHRYSVITEVTLDSTVIEIEIEP